MGMGTYLSNYPETSAAPRLSAWLDGIHSFINILISSGVSEINVITRPELAFEKGTDAPKPEEKPKAAAKPAATSKGKKNEPAAPVILLEEKAVLDRYPFDVTFTSTNRAFNDVLTKLANTSSSTKPPSFFNIRVLRVENEQKLGAETSAQVSVVEAVDETNQKPFKRDSIYIFGVEKIQVHLGLDLIRFAEPETTEIKKTEAKK